MANTPSPLGAGGLSHFDVPTVFRCGAELAEAAAGLTEQEWADVPADCEGPTSPHFERQMEASRRLRRLEEETRRLKRSLGATGPLDFRGGETDGGATWESYDWEFNETDHDRAIRLGLHKLATAAIDLAGFATWREWQWHMRDTGLRLLGWGLAQLWDGMSDAERAKVRDRLPRTHKAIGWPANPKADPPAYDGPEEIPSLEQYRIKVNYVSCYRNYPDDSLKADDVRTERNHEMFLRRATLVQFVEAAERAEQAIQAWARGQYDTNAERSELYTTTFWQLACLRRAHEVQPREAWPTFALEQRKLLAEAANIFLACVWGTPEAKAGLEPADANKAFEDFTQAIRQLRAIANPTNHGSTESVHMLGMLADTEQGPEKPSDPAPGNASLALMRVFTNGIADDRIEKATWLLADDNLTANEKLAKIDALIPFPATASAEQLGEMLGVTKQAVLKTDWWKQNRKGEKESEVGRRREEHRRRAKSYDSPGQDDDE